MDKIIAWKFGEILAVDASDENCSPIQDPAAVERTLREVLRRRDEVNAWREAQGLPPHEWRPSLWGRKMTPVEAERLLEQLDAARKEVAP